MYNPHIQEDEAAIRKAEKLDEWVYGELSLAAERYILDSKYQPHDDIERIAFVCVPAKFSLMEFNRSMHEAKKTFRTCYIDAKKRHDRCFFCQTGVQHEKI